MLAGSGYRLVDMFANIPYFGEILAFATAIIWAMAVILFKKSGETVHPIGLNIYKGIFSFILVELTIIALGHDIILDIPGHEYLLLLLSGVLGIGIADTLFFKTLNLLGAGLTAVVDCLYSPFMISLSIVFLSESMSVWQISGVLMIISAVLIVSGIQDGSRIPRRDIWMGIAMGALAMLSMAVSIVMVKPILDRLSLLWVTNVRMVGGLITLAVLLPFFRQRKRIIGSLTSMGNWKYMLPGSFLGAYLSLILWLGGMKYAQVSVAAALNQTNNVFVFFFAAVFLKETITRQKALAIILAIAGALMTTFG